MKIPKPPKPKNEKKEFKRLEAFADKLWKERIKSTGIMCEVCEKEPVNTIHHFFSKRNFRYLKFSLDNGVRIGKSCHFKHHHLSDPRITATIIKKRGQKWYQNLKDKAENPPKYFKYNRQFIEKVIKELKND